MLLWNKFNHYNQEHHEIDPFGMLRESKVYQILKTLDLDIKSPYENTMISSGDHIYNYQFDLDGAKQDIKFISFTSSDSICFSEAASAKLLSSKYIQEASVFDILAEQNCTDAELCNRYKSEPDANIHNVHRSKNNKLYVLSSDKFNSITVGACEKHKELFQEHKSRSEELKVVVGALVTYCI